MHLSMQRHQKQHAGKATIWAAVPLFWNCIKRIQTDTSQIITNEVLVFLLCVSDFTSHRYWLRSGADWSELYTFVFRRCALRRVSTYRSLDNLRRQLKQQLELCFGGWFWDPGHYIGQQSFIGRAPSSQKWWQEYRLLFERERNYYNFFMLTAWTTASGYDVSGTHCCLAEYHRGSYAT